MTIDTRLVIPAALMWIISWWIVQWSPVAVFRCAPLLMVLAGVFYAVTHREHRRTRWGGIVIVSCALGAAVSLTVGCQGVGRSWLADETLDGMTASVVGSVTHEAHPLHGIDPDRHHLMLQATQMTVRGVSQQIDTPIRVVTSEDVLAGFGAQLAVTGTITRWDHEAVLEAVSPVHVLSPAAPAWADQIRMSLRGVTENLSPQAAGLVPGLAIGDTKQLDPEIEAAMQSASLTHLTAVSGGHFVVVVTAVLWCVAGMPRYIRGAIGAVTTVLLVVIVHPEPSVVRAALMSLVGVLALFQGRRAQAPAALSLAVILMMLWDPWWARSYGFTMSVVASGSLIAGVPGLTRWLQRWCWPPLARALAVPMVAQLGVAPVTILLNPVLLPYGVLANILVAPVVAPVTILAVGAALLAPWWPGGSLALAWVAGCGTAWIVRVARWCADLPGSSIPWVSGALGALLFGGLSVMAILLIWWLSRQRFRWLSATSRQLMALGIVSILVFAGMYRWSQREAPDDWVVVACDVGQGDALMIRSGEGSAVLIDVGPELESMRQCLQQLRVHRIDLLVLSHDHQDHIGGLAAALELPIRKALIPQSSGQPVQVHARLENTLRSSGVPIQSATTGDGGYAGQVQWQVIQTVAANVAVQGDDVEGAVTNDASVITRFSVQGIEIVTLGDMEKASQERLLTSHPAPVDILKVAHHGSSTQVAELMSQLSPRIAIISVGENTYGHPSAKTIELLLGQGARVLRTDQCGAVVVLEREGKLGSPRCT